MQGAFASDTETEPVAPEHGAAAVLPRSFGDYELLEEISRGGMGIVYKARQKSLGRIVAVKMLLSGLQADFDTIRRFRVEAVAAGSLKHPHIVPIHEVGQHDGQRFIVMDYMAGGNLARQARKPLPPRRAAELLATIASAVHYAHQHRVLHRDLKPSNILMDESGQPHVTDFGLAKGLESSLGDEALADDHATVVLYEQRTEDGQVLGSPAYMPPEQADGRVGGVGRWSDVYSLGAMLYHLLTGKPPFEGASATDTLHRVLHDPVVSPRRRNPAVPRDLETICLKCLEKEPARRYRTAQELADDLGRYLRHEPVQARPVGRSEKTWRWCRRNPMATAFVLTLCVALGLSLGLLCLVNQAKNKEVLARKELEVANKQAGHLLALTVNMLQGDLEGLWASTDKRYLTITSDQLAALSARPIVEVTNKSAITRYKLGLSANESPVDEARRYSYLCGYLEEAMGRRLGQTVRLDLELYKYADERLQALARGELDFVRTGGYPVLYALQEGLPIRALVEQVNQGRPAVFFTRTNSGIHSLADLKGRAMAFGETNATISFVAQVRLAGAGLSARELSKYDFLDSRSEFMEDVLDSGYAEALKRVGHLHSHVEVIERVIDGTYDVGISSLRAFERNERRGLVMIPGSAFENIRNPWIARASLAEEVVQSFVAAMTALHAEGWLPLLPDEPTGYRVITEQTYSAEREALRRIQGLFPWKSPTNAEPRPLRGNR